MSGSLGGGRSSSSQQSTSSGFSQSESISQSGSQSGQRIAFEDQFRDLYGNASGAAGRASVGAQSLTDAARSLFTGGSEFLGSLGGDAGSNYLENRLSADNPVLNEQIAQLQEDTGRLFREEFNPAITARAVSGGTLGGGRQGVAQGLAIDSATRAFTQGATALRAGDIASRDAAAQSIAQNSLQSAATGLGSLPSLLGLLQSGNNSELDVYSRLGGILGGPTTLTESSSVAESLSRAYGEQESQSSGRSRSWNFDTSASFL